MILLAPILLNSSIEDDQFRHDIHTWQHCWFLAVPNSRFIPTMPYRTTFSLCKNKTANL